MRGISNLPPGGEPYSLSFATDAACVPGNLDSGGIVRETLSNAQISQALQQSGITLQVQGTSPTSARVFYSSNLGGVPLSWTIVHPIDDASPLAGRTRESLEEARAEILVLLTGIDETAGNDAIERGNNFGVGNQRLQFVNVGLGFEVFTLSDIDVLARD